MVLPPRPLRLKPSFVWTRGPLGVVHLLVATGLVAIAGLMAYATAHDLSEESRIWETGVTAPEASAEAKVRKRRRGERECVIDVRYFDLLGVPHRHKIAFDAMSGIDDSKPPVVRYLEEAPDRFAVSWALEARTGRIGCVVFRICAAGLIGTMFAVLGIRALKRLSLLRRRALDSEEVTVRITKVEPRRSMRGHEGSVCHYAGKTADGREVSGSESFSRNREPLFADASGETLVVLVDPADPGPALVVRKDFHPFLLTPEEQEAVRAAIKAR